MKAENVRCDDQIALCGQIGLRTPKETTPVTQSVEVPGLPLHAGQSGGHERIAKGLVIDMPLIAAAIR